MNGFEDTARDLREAVKTFIRNLGMLEGKKAFCCDCTYSQCHIIVEVGGNGAISLIELAQSLNMDKSAVSRTVDDLVKKGLIKREQDPRDRRYVVIELTEAGYGIHEQIEKNSMQQFSKLVAALSETEREYVIAGLLALNKALPEIFCNNNGKTGNKSGKDN